MIHFDSVAVLPNSGFETGDLSFWKVDTSMNQMVGQVWAEGPDIFGFTVDNNPTVDDWVAGKQDTMKAAVLSSAAYSGSYGLYLAFSGNTKSYDHLGSEMGLWDYTYTIHHKPSFLCFSGRQVKLVV